MAFATFGRLEHGCLDRMRSQHLGDSNMVFATFPSFEHGVRNIW
jgi:hypothetical protein